MGKLENLHALIDANITPNGQQGITGGKLNEVLNEVADLIPEVVQESSGYDDTEIKAELAKKAEVHVIVSLDFIMDSINGDIGSKIPMSNADVDAILSGKIIASESPNKGYILADEVFYDEYDNNPRMGYLVFHYLEAEMKVVFDLTNKVYLGSKSYYKAIAQKDYVDGKVTELSDEIKDVSERVDELGEGGSCVFEAIYGTTTYAEIVEAYNAKKHVLCIWNDRVYNLSAVTDTLVNFSCVKDSVIYIASCKTDNVWGYLQYNVEFIRNKVYSINEASTDSQYPSAKAVYDFVNNTLGTLINGEY